MLLAVMMRLRVRQLKMRKGFRAGVRRGAVSVSVTGLVAGTRCDTLPGIKISGGNSFLEAVTQLEMPLPGFGRTGLNRGAIAGGAWEPMVGI